MVQSEINSVEATSVASNQKANEVVLNSMKRIHDLRSSSKGKLFIHFVVVPEEDMPNHEKAVIFIEEMRKKNWLQKLTPEMATSLMEQEPQGYILLPDTLRADRAVAFAAVSAWGHNISVVPQEYQSDESFALASAGTWEASSGGNWSHMLQYLPNRSKHDREFVKKYLAKNGCQITGLTTQVGEDDPILVDFARDKELNVIAVRSAPFSITRIFEYRNDPDVVEACVATDGSYLKYWSSTEMAKQDRKRTISNCDQSLCNNKKIALAAVEQTPNAMKYIGNQLQDDPDIIAAYQAHGQK